MEFKAEKYSHSYSEYFPKNQIPNYQPKQQHQKGKNGNRANIFLEKNHDMDT